MSRSYQEVRRAGKNVVAKRNESITGSRQNLNRMEMSAILYLISKIKPTDSPDKVYEFRCDEFLALMRIHTNSYTNIKGLLAKVASIVWWEDSSDYDKEDDRLVSWFKADSVRANKKTGIITIQFSESARPYIFQLKEQRTEQGLPFTSYALENVILMKHYYSQRLYELLKVYSNNKTWWFELGTGTERDLYRRLAKVDEKTKKSIIPSRWKNWSNFNRDVLIPAQNDINRYSDLTISYKACKTDRSGNKYRRYVLVYFQITSKTASEMNEVSRVIDSEYEAFTKEDTYHQIDMNDYLAELEQDASPIVEEESSVNSPQEQDIEIIEKPVGEPCTAASDPFVGRPPIIDEQPVIREAPAKQRAIMPEGFELLYSVLGGEFSEKEIGYLYKTARRKFLLSGRSVDEQDGMLTDYVLYYHDKMDATSEQTKTTPYNRLFDMVRKDYDGQAQEITVRYSYE